MASTTREKFASFINNRWLVFVAAMWIQSCAGNGYLFGSISPVIKSSLNYNQKELARLGVAKDLGDSVGFIAGSLSENFPLWVALLVGAVQNLVGYGWVWLIVTGRAPVLPLWAMCFLIFAGNNGETYFNTGSLVSGVQNFPKSRGPVVGILKGFAGLGGAILSQIYTMIHSPDPASIILMVAVAPAVVAVSLMFFIRPVGGHRQLRPTDGASFTFIYGVCILLAVYLMAVMLIEDLVVVSHNIVTIFTIVLFVILVVPVLVPIMTSFFMDSNGPVDTVEEPLVPKPEEDQDPGLRTPDLILSEVEDEKPSDVDSLPASERHKRIAQLQTQLMQAAAKGAVRVKGRRGPHRGEDFTLMQGDNDDVINKPDFRELDLGSPVSTLMPRVSTSSAAATPTSSSGSSGSASGKPSVAGKSHSGEIPGGPGSVMPAVKSLKPGHRRSSSTGKPLIFSGSSFSHSATSHSSATSPSPAVLPAGNICPSGRILKTGMATRSSTRAETLCTGTGNYGHGNVVRSGGGGSNHPARADGESPEELKRLGNDMYRRGNFSEALSLYDRAISLSPENAAFRSNRAAALTASGRLGEAVKECLEAVRLDPSYSRAHQRLASLYLRLGEAENARRHLCFSGQCPDQTDLQRLQMLEKHLRRCWEARKIGDWRTVVKETDLAIENGADSSPQLVACKAEALLRLNQMEDSDFCISSIPRHDHYYHTQPQAKLFGMVAEAYILCIQSQVDMALGRFESGVVKAERAAMLDQTNPELVSVLNNVKMVVKARTLGNELFSSGRYSEASVAYGDGLKQDGSNSVLYCNRAACWYKLGLWEKSVEDCNQALKIHPSYIKALLRRAASYGKLGRWEDAVRDYEFVRRELPGDSEVAESLERAKIAVMNRSQESKSFGYNNQVEAVSNLDKFKNVVSLPGVSVFHFKSSSNRQCEEISPFINTLCLRYPLVHFFMVDVEESVALAKAESIRKVPTFKMYKNGDKVKEMICPSHQFLEDSIKHFLL